MRLCRTLLLLWILFSFQVRAVPVESIHIGLAEDAFTQNHRFFIDKTLALLGHVLFPEYALEVDFLEPGTVITASLRNQFDVILMSSADYRRSLLSGTRDIAVLRPSLEVNPNRAEGVAFFVDILNTQITSLSDLRGMRAGMVGEFTTTEYMSMDGAILQASGQHSDHFLGSCINFGQDLKAAVNSLISRESDFLIMPVCALERLSTKQLVNTDRLTILGAKQDHGLACLHSSELYPGATLVAMPSLSLNAYNAILSAILRMNEEENETQWAIATNFSAVDRTLQSLDDDAWSVLRHPSWEKILTLYWPWIVGAGGVLLLLFFHHLLLGLLVRRRTKELSFALEEQKRLRVEADRIRDRLDKMRRLQTIGQLASLFAHELRQPLNALSCYAYGVRKAVSKVSEDVRSEADIGITGLEKEVQRANAIVERVRDYVRSQSSRNHKCRLDCIVATAIDHFKTSNLGGIPIFYKTIRGEASTIRCDAMEIELLIINLLRNSAQAQNNTQDPFIKVKVEGGNVVRLSVSDNGPALSQSDYDNIVSLGESTKPEGLGLGLSIVRDISEAHQGTLRFSLSSRASLVVEISFLSSKSETL